MSLIEKLSRLKDRIGKIHQMSETKPVLLVYVLDETGSMSPVKHATISGYNEFVNSLKNYPKASEQLMTLITFDTLQGTNFRYVNNPLTSTPPLTIFNYHPNSGTPLYDAIMDGINEAEKYQKTHDILFVIHTDGEENASKRYNKTETFHKIKNKQTVGWVFTFLGATEEAYREGMNLGIHLANIARTSHTSAGTKRAYEKAATNIGTYMFGMTTSERVFSNTTLLNETAGQSADWTDDAQNSKTS